MQPRPAMAAVATVTAAVITFGAFARGGGASDEPGASAPPSAAESTTSAGDRATTTASSPPPEEETRELDVEAGMTSHLNPLGTRHTSAGAVLTNPNEEAAYGVEVTFELKNASGAVLDTARESVPYVPAHGHRIVAPLQVGFDLATEPASLEVATQVREFAEDVGPEGGEDIMRRPDGARLEVVRAGFVDGQYLSKVTGQVLNLTSEVARFSSVHCVLRSEGGIVGGAASGISAPILPGGTIAFESMLASPPEDVDTVDCEVHASPKQPTG